MAEPTTVEEVVVPGKRKPPGFMARAARTARMAVKDPGALVEGAVTLPGALARATRQYVTTHTPGEALSDAARVGKGMFQDVVEHPLQTVAGALPVVGGVMSAYDTAKAREAAAEARARGDERTAKTYEQIAAGTGATILAGMVPFGRTVGKGVLKEGEEAALREAEKLATKYGLDEFITDLTPEQRAANRAAYPTPAYHGTPRSYGNEGAFTAFQDQNLGDEYMLDRRLGTHFARDPEVSNSFTHADWDKGTAALPGSHVLPVQLPPEHELLTVEQPLIPWTDPNSPDYRPMPNPGEVREPLHKTDQRAIEELIAVEAYKRDPELLARYLVQARAVAPEDASLLAKQLVAGHEVVLPHDGPTNLKSFVGNFGGNPYNDADRAQMVTLAREALRERGYKGLRYINTSKRETAGAADPTSYIIFDPKHVKSRFNRGTYDPNDPHLNKARGGIVAKYADGGLVKAVRAAAGGRTDEAKWKRIVASVKASGKGGAPGQWSARKAQLATQRYQASGGRYRGPKTKAQQSLSKWTNEDWGTKSGKPSTQGPEATGERYLPKSAREALTPSEYAATTRAKRKGAAEGKQFVKQPERIAQKTSRYR